MEIIIRGKRNFGKTRSEQEKNLRKSWGSTMSDESLSKLEYMEKKSKEINGSKENFFGQHEVERVK